MFQDTDEGKVAKAFVGIHAVADDEIIGDFQARVIGLYRFNAAGGFVQQHTDADAPRLERAQLGQHLGQGAAGVEDVVHQEHVTAADIEAQFLGKDEFALKRDRSWRRR